MWFYKQPIVQMWETSSNEVLCFILNACIVLSLLVIKETSTQSILDSYILKVMSYSQAYFQVESIELCVTVKYCTVM